jgi:hypothetical protein
MTHIDQLVIALVVASLSAPARATTEDMDFIAEHLSEVAMDNRLLTLPVWYSGEPGPRSLDWQFESGYQRIASGGLKLSGFDLGIGARRALNARWALGGFAVFDRSAFDGTTVARPVTPLFSDSIPLDLPADARLTNLRGHLTQSGAGLAATWRPPGRRYLLTAGVAYLSVRQQGYRIDYALTSGASAGASGTLDYSAAFHFWIPTAGIEWHWQRGSWELAPRLQAGIPLPRYGWRGRISGPGFDVAGDTDNIGNGKHMGDAFAGIGVAITYQPWHLSCDLGTLLSQELIEPRIHEGVSSVWMLNLRWQP